MKNLNRISYATSEAVSPGHPDKLMDTIVERLYYYVRNLQGDNARFAMDGLIKNNHVWLAGEVSGWNDDVEVQARKIVETALASQGYGQEYLNHFLPGSVWDITFCVTTQSVDIAKGVNLDGAGDIGIMYGYASDETPDCTFTPHYIARRLVLYFWKMSRKGIGLYPDIKALVTVKYYRGVPVGVSNVTVCVSHTPGYDFSTIRTLVSIQLGHICGELRIDHEEADIQVNPTGAFTIYGPVADSGAVGRKIVCDQYGGALGCPVGGGNLNGKDFTKVDRSGVYLARNMAKSIVMYGLASRAVVQVAYAIGCPDAVSVNVETEGSSIFTKASIRNLIASYDTSVRGIITQFDLHRMFISHHNACGAWGHIGELGGILFPWEVVR